MAVCRGKVSEGLDFADNNARAVITVRLVSAFFSLRHCRTFSVPKMQRRKKKLFQNVCKQTYEYAHFLII